MDIATLDFETFWDTDYTLSKLSPLEYVMDKRFELISLAVKINAGRPKVHFGMPRILAALRAIDWSKTAALGHNMSAFDSYIMAYVFKIVPVMWFCTLAMARPIHAKDVGLSLGKLVAHYGLGVKNNAVLLQTKGKRLKDFTRDELIGMAKYNGEDDDQCYDLFQILKRHYTAAELWQIDALVRLRTEPAFELDFAMLDVALSIERTNKHKALLGLARQIELTVPNWSDEVAVAEQVRVELASAPKFSALLDKLGVPVPFKPSPKDETKLIPALAKNDEAFIALQSHENPIVVAATMARLSVKSTLTESRIEAFKTAGQLAGGRLPLPIKYCGADTSGRDSGEEYNPQNLPRILKKKPRPSDALRNSLRAPEGHSIIVADQSGIELRTSHFLSQVEESMKLYQANAMADLYRAFGATLYNCTPEEVDDIQRQACKVGQLQLQFGSGWKTYLHKAHVDGGLVDMQPEEAESIVYGWRAKYHAITYQWSQFEKALRCILRGEVWQIDPWGHAWTCAEGIRLRSGRIIRYPALRNLDKHGVVREFFKGVWPSDEAKVDAMVGWWYGTGRNKRRIYGAKAFQNTVQALARDSIFDCSLTFYRETGLRFNLRTHDELAYVVPTPKAEGLLERLQRVLRTSPQWWPELVVWSEGGVARTYGAAK